MPDRPDSETVKNSPGEGVAFGPCASPACPHTGYYPSKRAGLCPDHWAANVAAHAADVEGLDKELAQAEFEYFEDLATRKGATS